MPPKRLPKSALLGVPTKVTKTKRSESTRSSNTKSKSRTDSTFDDKPKETQTLEEMIEDPNVAKVEVAKLVPGENDLLKAKRVNDLAQQLMVSKAVLNAKLAAIEEKLKEGAKTGALPFQVRRAQAEREMLLGEVRVSERAIRILNIMHGQMEEAMKLRARVLEETREELEKEIASLEESKTENADNIRAGYIDRINVLQRYWPWRQLLELGDTTVGSTFAQELARGPRYRNVSIQNNIQSDYIAQQLRWLQQLSEREETFRNYMRSLDMLVEDLADISNLLQSTLTCSVCELLFEEPVLFWPCGHTFCAVCFESLLIAPNLFRCPVCGSIGSEGYVHNLLVAETVAKWMFKDAGYGDLHGSMNSIRLHLSRFKREKVQGRIDELTVLLQQQRLKEHTKGIDTDKSIEVSYRAY